jgi:hypothetical protein
MKPIAFKTKKRLAMFAVYLGMIAFIAWQAVRLLPGVASSASDESLIDVEGNVLRPGSYRVGPGVTQFEILKVAGIRPTSDISLFDLTKQISGNQQIEVGTMPNPISLKTTPSNVRMEFFMGQINVIAGDGKSRSAEEGMELSAGDRMLTEEKSQAELSVSAYSRIDVDEFSELAVDKISADEKGKKLIAVSQKTGACWYKIAYTGKSELFKTITPLVNVTAAGTGGDFMVIVKQDEVDIHDMDGLLLVERPTGTEAINMISGQTAVIFNDNRPIQVTQLAAEANPTDRFSMLTKEKSSVILRHMPLNFVFCAIPNVYFFISIQFEGGKLHIVHIPGATSVDEFVQGCTTLDQAFLYGGGVFVSTLIEQIMDTRISKYCVFDKEKVLRVAGAIGGVRMDVDEKAAAVLKVPKGFQKLSAVQLITFLKPGSSGSEDYETRQTKVIKALFEGLRSKNIILTGLLTEQLITNIETNFTTGEIMDHYAKFLEVKNWTTKDYALPVKRFTQNGRNRVDPILEECKTLLNN